MYLYFVIGKNCYEIVNYNKFVYLLVRLLKMHFRPKVHFLFTINFAELKGMAVYFVNKCAVLWIYFLLFPLKTYRFLNN
jgi:hypothetical protein